MSERRTGPNSPEVPAGFRNVLDQLIRLVHSSRSKPLPANHEIDPELFAELIASGKVKPEDPVGRFLEKNIKDDDRTKESLTVYLLEESVIQDSEIELGHFGFEAQSKEYFYAPGKAQFAFFTIHLNKDFTIEAHVLTSSADPVIADELINPLREIGLVEELPDIDIDANGLEFWTNLDSQQTDRLATWLSTVLPE